MYTSGKHTIKVFLFALLLCTLIPVHAVEFRNISINEGLSNRRVFSSAIDHKGFIWFATRVGIDKYDGGSFVHYNFKAYNDSYKIRGVIADKQGNIFAFTEKSIYIFNYAADRYLPIPVTKDDQQSILNTETINTLYFDNENAAWLGTSNGVLRSSDLKKWMRIPASDHKGVYSFCDGLNGDFWMGTSAGIRYIEHTGAKKYKIKTIHALSYFNSNRIQSLFFDYNSHKLWIGTFSNGLFLYTTQNTWGDKLKCMLHTTSPIRSIASVNDENRPEIWVGTDGAGAFIYNKTNETLTSRYTQNSNSDGNFVSNSIYHILGKGNQIWISTYSSGILTGSTQNMGYKTYKHLKNEPNSLYNNQVNAVLEDNNRQIWFGTNSGISIYNPTVDKWKHLLTNDNNDGSAVILTMCELGENIWAGGFASDLYCIHKTSGVVKSFNISNPANRFAAKNYTYSICADSNGNLWFGGNLDELTCFNPNTGETKFFNIIGINKIEKLDNAHILIGSVHGLYKLHIPSGKITHIDFSLTRLQGKPISTFINSIFPDPNRPDILWLGSEGDGLYRYNLITKKVRIFNTQRGLSSNYIYGIVGDSYGRLWMSSENGLNCFNTRTDINQSYFVQDGLVDNTFNFLAYFKLKNGNMIWGTPKGASEIIPEEIQRSYSPINLRFTGFNLFYKNITAGQEDSPLDNAIDDTQKVVLEHDQNSFSFNFIDLNITQSPQIMYSWRLDGFDEAWTKPAPEHKAVYTNIPPGTYTFSVKAYKLGNNNQTITRSIEVVISPPWWKSTLAFIFYFLMLIALIRVINFYMKKRLEAQNSEQKIRFFINMAHDVRTPITLVKAPLNQLEQEELSEDGKAALRMAQRNLEKLFNMVTQLLDFQKAESDSMKLLVEKTRINHFTQQVVNSFRMIAKDKEIDLELELPTNEYEVWIDRRKVALCLENLISNAIKYTPKKGNIQIKIDILENTLVAEITDDGIGIPANDQKNLFERFYRAENAANSKETGSGIGLMFTRKLIHLHKGKISFVSTENIGTTFHFEIPCMEENFRPEEKVLREDEENDSPQVDSSEELSRDVKLLLVEDNDEIREYLSHQMRREYQVIEASDGKEALEKVKTDAPDFILSDIMMPGMSGFELCSILKNQTETCHIPIILLSSLAERKDILTGFQAGADDYITKPFDLTILETKIKTILKNRNLFKKKYIAGTAQKHEFSSINEQDKAFMEKVVNFVEENLTNEEFTIEHLAMEMAMSRSVFYKKLKALTDANPKDLIKDIKMRKASDLLREGKYPITEIAFLTGFPNSKYFSTAFKKYYGVSPSRYLNENAEEEKDDSEE